MNTRRSSTKGMPSGLARTLRTHHHRHYTATEEQRRQRAEERRGKHYSAKGGHKARSAHLRFAKQAEEYFGQRVLRSP